MTDDDRPAMAIDRGLQHERTTLAWERTAISLMVAGIVLGRFAAVAGLWFFAGAGLVLTAFGAGVLVWAGIHYDSLHAMSLRGDDVVHPAATRRVGLATVIGVGLGLVAAILVAIE